MPSLPKPSTSFTSLMKSSWVVVETIHHILSLQLPFTLKKTAALLFDICHWLVLQKKEKNHVWMQLSQRKILVFCFFFFSVPPFTFVLQLHQPLLAEICVCLGQTVFPSLSLLYATALLLDPQWQWRGTLVFNLFSHSQILCFQVINLCSPFTACCMLCVTGLRMPKEIDGWRLGWCRITSNLLLT